MSTVVFDFIELFLITDTFENSVETYKMNMCFYLIFLIPFSSCQDHQEIDLYS